MTVYVYVRDFIAHHHRPGGGLYKAVAGLAGGIVSAGGTVDILCEGDHDVLDVSPLGYTVRCFKAAKNPGTFGNAPGLKDFISRLPRPGVFALNGIFVPGNVGVARLLRKIGRPYVVAPHDPFHPEIFAKGRLRKAVYWQLFERPMLRGAAAVQLLDARHGTYLRDNRIGTPTIEVPNGYAADDVLPESTLAFRTQAQDGRMRFYFLGRVDAHNKGLDLLIDAFTSLRRELGDRFDAELTIQGPDWGDSKALADRAASAGAGERVKILPPDFTATSPRLIASHDVLCMPSRFEGFGLSALEAMLNARVVMVSEIAGLAPHVRACDGGVVVDPTVASIRSGLLELADSRSRWEQIGRRSRAYALDRFRWDRIGAECLAAYGAILSNAPNAGRA